MKAKTIRKLISINMAALMTALILSGCSVSGSNTSSDGTVTEASDGSGDSDTDDESDKVISVSADLTGNYSDKALSAEWSDSQTESTLITFSSDGVSITGKKVASTKATQGSDYTTVTITEKGTYVISGTNSAAQIYVDVDEDDNVQLVLNGANLSNSYAAPIVVVSAKNTYLTVADGTENSISDLRSSDSSQSDDDDSEITAAIYSACDLIINGNGTLNVTGSYNDGIKTKDDFQYISGTLNITAYDDGIVGHDSVSIRDGSISITCSDDCVKSSNEDEDKGFIIVDNGTLTLNSASGHGLNSKNSITINNGTITIPSSYEGIQSRYVTINDGTIDITSSDDGINISYKTTSTDSDTGNDTAYLNTTTVDTYVENTAFDMSDRPEPPDGGFGGDSDGERPELPDDFNGERPEMPDDFDGTMPDDFDGDFGGWNSDDSDTNNGFGGRGGRGGFGGGGFGGGMMDGDGIDGNLTINGGTITINAGGDGLDSNGYMYINGGYIVVSGSEGGGDSALDSAFECVMNGGTLLLSGNSGMAEYISDDSAVTMVNAMASSYISAGSTISLVDSSGNTIYTWTNAKKANYLQAAGEELSADETYTFVVDGSEYEATTDHASGMGGGFGGGGFGGGGFGGKQ